MGNANLLAAALLLAALTPLEAQNKPAFNGQEKAISDRMHQLRSLPDDQWTAAAGSLARQIQALPQGQAKGLLIGTLANLVTEGDAGQATLQIVASTLAEVLRNETNAASFETLANLVRYEHCQVSLDNLRFHEALDKLAAQDARRESADFALADLHGTKWSLKSLRGKVVLVNFWATWCPPCRKEMPDMETLYRRFGPRGLVILAISDEEQGTVETFLADRKFSYPVLLDPGRKVNEHFAVEGIPKSFLYDREGKLVAQAIDRRTEAQFLAMLKQAGLE